MDNKIIIVDEENNEYEYDIALTFDHLEKEYAIVTNDDENYYVFEYDEKTKNIKVVEDDEVLAQADELLNTLMPLKEDYEEEE